MYFDKFGHGGASKEVIEGESTYGKFKLRPI
jgi:hypothetical protein